MVTKPSSSSSQSEPADTAAQLILRSGRAHDVAGHMEEAIASYEQAIRLAEQAGAAEGRVLVEALRRLGVVHHRGNRIEEARNLCRRSLKEAVGMNDLVLAGEALNALAGFDTEVGDISAARALYRSALPLSQEAPGLQGRIEQNLGILSSIQGDHEEAFQHYQRALDAFRLAGDESGVAIAYHNLGQTGTCQGDLDEADRCFAVSASRAVRNGEVYLEGLCQLSRAEVAHRRQQFSEALRRAEAGLETFERIGARFGQSRAYKVIGMVLRDSGRAALAEDRLRHALAIAKETGSLLDQAEAARELSRLHEGAGRKQEAVALLNVAKGLFQRLNARADLEDVNRRMVELVA